MYASSSTVFIIHHTIEYGYITCIHQTATTRYKWRALMRYSCKSLNCSIESRIVGGRRYAHNLHIMHLAILTRSRYRYYSRVEYHRYERRLGMSVASMHAEVYVLFQGM